MRATFNPTESSIKVTLWHNEKEALSLLEKLEPWFPEELKARDKSPVYFSIPASASFRKLMQTVKRATQERLIKAAVANYLMGKKISPRLHAILKNSVYVDFEEK